MNKYRMRRHDDNDAAAAAAAADAAAAAARVYPVGNKNGTVKKLEDVDEAEEGGL